MLKCINFKAFVVNFKVRHFVHNCRIMEILGTNDKYF